MWVKCWVSALSVGLVFAAAPRAQCEVLGPKSADAGMSPGSAFAPQSVRSRGASPVRPAGRDAPPPAPAYRVQTDFPDPLDRAPRAVDANRQAARYGLPMIALREVARVRF